MTIIFLYAILTTENESEKDFMRFTKRQMREYYEVAKYEGLPVEAIHVKTKMSREKIDFILANREAFEMQRGEEYAT